MTNADRKLLVAIANSIKAMSAPIYAADLRKAVAAVYEEMSALPKRKLAKRGTFDRTTYQRELMRKRAAAKKEAAPK